MSRGTGRLRGSHERGQAMVEFSIGVLFFLIATLGVVDTSRAVFDKHGLGRAAEAIAHRLVLDYATIGGYSISSASAAIAIQDAQTVSDASFSSAEPHTFDITHSTYQEMSNGSVFICASPNFASAQVIQVTVVGSFRPASSLFIGGRSVPLSESATALTFAGEMDGGTYQTQCPAH
jgi:Flp pilus assembly protein TadG